MSVFAYSGLAIVVVLVVFALASPVRILNLLASTDGLNVSRDHAYGDDPRQRLDIYAPETAQGAPVVVFFYGGDWQTGTKETYAFAVAALAERGFVTVVPDYRLYPQVRFPEFLHDGDRALRWVAENVARFGGDAANIHLAGHSAGAYIAAMLAYADPLPGAAGPERRPPVASFVGIAGPYDFLPIDDPTRQEIFGGPDRTITQPISHVTADAPPSLLISGTSDKTVDPGNVERLGARLEALGVPVERIFHNNLSHRLAVGVLSPWLSFLAPVTDQIAAHVLAHEPTVAGDEAAR